MAHHHQISVANDAFQPIHAQTPSCHLSLGCCSPSGESPRSQAVGAAPQQSSVVIFCLSSVHPSLCSPENCVFQVQIPDQLQVLNGCLEIMVCSFFYYYYYYCCYCYYYYYYYLMLLFASGSISSQFPRPKLPPRQGICFAHLC